MYGDSVTMSTLGIKVRGKCGGCGSMIFDRYYVQCSKCNQRHCYGCPTPEQQTKFENFLYRFPNIAYARNLCEHSILPMFYLQI